MLMYFGVFLLLADGYPVGTRSILAEGCQHQLSPYFLAGHRQFDLGGRQSSSFKNICTEF
jgi:hypothetical protein